MARPAWQPPMTRTSVCSYDPVKAKRPFELAESTRRMVLQPSIDVRSQIPGDDGCAGQRVRCFEGLSTVSAQGVA
jgi:hypothetical protein